MLSAGSGSFVRAVASTHWGSQHAPGGHALTSLLSMHNYGGLRFLGMIQSPECMAGPSHCPVKTFDWPISVHACP